VMAEDGGVADGGGGGGEGGGADVVSVMVFSGM